MPKKGEKKKLDMEDIRNKENDMLRKGLDKGDFEKDLVKFNDEDTAPMEFGGKYYEITYKWPVWERQNQIKTALLKAAGRNLNPMDYERKYQERLIKEMVLKINDTNMYDAAKGEPIDSQWLKIPTPFGEQLRFVFFKNTGEVTARMLLETKSESIDDLISMLKHLKGLEETPDGVVAAQEEILGG